MRFAIVLLILSLLSGVAALVLWGGLCRGGFSIEECAPYRDVAINLVWPVAAALGIASLVLFMLGARMPDGPAVRLTWRSATVAIVLFSFLAGAFFFFISVAIYATREDKSRGNVFLEMVAPTIALGVAFFIVTLIATILYFRGGGQSPQPYLPRRGSLKRTLRTVGAAVLTAGIVGTVLFVAWFFEYQRGLGGFLTGLRGPLLYIVVFGFFWGPLLLVVAFVLLSWMRWGRRG